MAEATPAKLLHGVVQVQRSFQLSLLMSIAVLSAGVGGASCGRTGLGADDLEDDNQGRPPVDSGLDVALADSPRNLVVAGAMPGTTQGL